jgi:hypothetical protein
VRSASTRRSGAVVVISVTLCLDRERTLFEPLPF